MRKLGQLRAEGRFGKDGRVGQDVRVGPAEGGEPVLERGEGWLGAVPDGVDGPHAEERSELNDHLPDGAVACMRLQPGGGGKVGKGGAHPRSG